MGGGYYNLTRGINRASQQYVATSNYSEVYTSKQLNKFLNPMNSIRESRDSIEHPESFPIIIGLDVTGSMGYIPHEIIKSKLNNIMKKLLENNIMHCQLMFMGIGDQYSDSAPLQVTQFETSDELIDKWLKLMWIEGGGGGNYSESYQLAWYYADKYTKIDSYEKRNIKGILITIGNESVHNRLESECIYTKVNNNNLEENKTITTENIFNNASKKYEIYHLDLPYIVKKDYFKSLLGERFKSLESSDDIENEIVSIILNHFKYTTINKIHNAPETRTFNIDVDVQNNQLDDAIL